MEEVPILFRKETVRVLLPGRGYEKSPPARYSVWQAGVRLFAGMTQYLLKSACAADRSLVGSSQPAAMGGTATSLSRKVLTSPFIT